MRSLIKLWRPEKGTLYLVMADLPQESPQILRIHPVLPSYFLHPLLIRGGERLERATSINSRIPDLEKSIPEVEEREKVPLTRGKMRACERRSP